MNLVILSGRLTKDWELKYLQDGKAIAKNILAVDGMKKQNGEKDTDFIGLTLFGKSAEFASNNTIKANRVNVIGRWKTGSYEKDGKKIYTNDCLVTEFKPIDWANSNNQQQPQQQPQQQQQYNYQQQPISNDPFATGNGSINISEDDLPF